MKRKHVPILAMLVSMAVMLSFANIVLAYDESDSEIDSVEFTFNDDAKAEYFIDGTNDNLSEGQNAITWIWIDAGHFDALANASEISYVKLTVTDPQGNVEIFYITQNGTWPMIYQNATGDEVPLANATSYYESGNYSDAIDYDFTFDGNYDFVFEQMFLINSTMYIYNEFEITLEYDYDGNGIDIGMGDLNLLNMTLGFIGLVGFVATPMVTAKLMGHKDPITVISAFLICMIIFGVFVYVFLLGGS